MSDPRPVFKARLVFKDLQYSKDDSFKQPIILHEITVCCWNHGCCNSRPGQEMCAEISCFIQTGSATHQTLLVWPTSSCTDGKLQFHELWRLKNLASEGRNPDPAKFCCRLSTKTCNISRHGMTAQITITWHNSTKKVSIYTKVSAHYYKVKYA